MKILLIGPDSRSNSEIIKAARKRGHSTTRAGISQFHFVLKKDDFRIYLRQRNIASFDACLIRGIKPKFDQAKIIAKYFDRHGKIAVDREMVNKVYVFDKMFMYAALEHHGLPVIDSYYFQNEEQYQKSRLKLPFPVLAKDLHGMRSKNIFSIANKRELGAFLKKHNVEDFFFQQYIDIQYMYRVLVIGKEVVGAIRRTAYMTRKGKDIREEESKTVAVPLTPQLKRLAKKAAKQTHTDIAGVDLIFDKDDNGYVLEVNRTPGFMLFQKKTGVNVGEKIIQYIEELHRKRRKKTS